MMVVTSNYARTHLCELLRKVEQGDTIRIKVRGKPTVKLKLIKKKKPARLFPSSDQ